MQRQLASILLVILLTFPAAAMVTSDLSSGSSEIVSVSRRGESLLLSCDFAAPGVDDAELAAVTRWIVVAAGGEVEIASINPHPAPGLEPASSEALSPAAKVGEPVEAGDALLYPVTFTPSIDGNSRRIALDGISAEITVRSPAPPRLRRVVREMMGDLLLNRDDLARDQEDESASGCYVYVIPDYNEVREAIAPLIAHRRMQGYNCIELAVPNGEASEYVFGRLLNINRSQKPIDYILLAGDFGGTYSVPSVMRGATCDYYYSFLEGRDVIPDAAVGRISYNSIAELRRIVAKIVRYEAEFDQQNQGWLRRAAIATGDQASGFSTLLAARWLREQFIGAGYTRVDTLWHTMNGSVSRFMEDSFEAGMMFVSFRGWTGMDDWSAQDALQLNNQALPVALLLACNSGDFIDAGAGFTEALLRANGGAVGAIGIAGSQSRINFNNAILGGFYRGVLQGQVSRLGWAVNRARVELHSIYGAYARELTQDHAAWLNLMGDPATLLWLGSPREVRLEVPEQQNFGSGSLTVRALYRADGRPVAGARIGLFKSGEIAAAGFTDAEGRTSISFDPSRVTPGNVSISATGYRILPVTAQTQLTRPAQQIAVAGFTITDDFIEPRHGNGNGVPNPMETILLTVRLNNFGGQPVNPVINCRLTSPTDHVEVLDGEEQIAQQMPPNNPVNVSFLVRIEGSFPDRELVPLTLTANAGGPDWTSTFYLYGAAPKWELAQLVLEALPTPGDPNYTFGLVITNSGSLDAPASRAEIIALSEDATMTWGDWEFDSIAVGGFNNSGDVFEAEISDNAVFGSELPFRISFATDTGYVGSFDFSIPMVSAPASEPTGPDAYGYWALDENDATNLVPRFEWVELDPAGGGDGTDTGILDQGEDDDESVYRSLPFTFKYYGRDYYGLTICSNGWAAFGDQRSYVDFRNLPIGSPLGPRAQLAVWWNDLYQPGARGGVFTHYDEANHRYIVEWSGMRRYIGPQGPGASATFQLILLDPKWHPTTTGDGGIIYQYRDVTNDARADGNGTPYSTVGIGDPEDAGGLQIGFWNRWSNGSAPIASSDAIRFATARLHRYSLVKGTVRRSADNAPVVGAIVRSTNGGWTTTDGQGMYRLPVFLAGIQGRIEASAAGFNTALSNAFQLPMNDSATVDLTLRAPTLSSDRNALVDTLQGGREGVHQIGVTNRGDGELRFLISVEEHRDGEQRSPRSESENLRDEPDEPWTRLLRWDATDSTGDNRILGVAFDGDRFIVAGGANGMLDCRFYRFNRQGGRIDRLMQPVRDLWGVHDLAWDGANLYGGVSDYILKMDNAGREVSRFVSPVRPARALAVQPGGEIWVGSEGNPICKLDRDGDILRTYDHSLHPYGFGWSPGDPDGAPLWIFSLDGETLLAVSKLDTATGEIYPITQLELQDGDRPGGFELTSRWDDHKWVMCAVIQNSGGDRIELLEIAPNTSWLSVDPREATLAAGANRALTARLRSAGLMGGDYLADIVLSHNAMGGEFRIPVSLYVEPVVASVEDPAPGVYHLAEVFPNPTNGSAVIQFELPHSDYVRLTIHDQTGRTVETLIEGKLETGLHQTVFAKDGLPSGVYIVQLEGSVSTQSRKFIMLR